MGENAYEDEAEAAIGRIVSVFSYCRSNDGGGHMWNLDTGKCDLCDRKFPYAEPASAAERPANGALP